MVTVLMDNAFSNRTIVQCIIRPNCELRFHHSLSPFVNTKRHYP